MNIRKGALIAALSLATLVPTMASAQDTVTADPTLATPVERDDDDDFPWGLLGLLGLAGLLGRTRKDHDEVRVNRTDRTDPNNRL